MLWVISLKVGYTFSDDLKNHTSEVTCTVTLKTLLALFGLPQSFSLTLFLDSKMFSVCFDIQEESRGFQFNDFAFIILVWILVLLTICVLSYLLYSFKCLFLQPFVYIQ